jgi:hypothetical protein
MILIFTSFSALTEASRLDLILSAEWDPGLKDTTLVSRVAHEATSVWPSNASDVPDPYTRAVSRCL